MTRRRFGPRFGPNQTNSKWTPEMDDLLEQMRALMGEDWDVIGAALGVSEVAAEVRAKILGIVMTPQAVAIARAAGRHRGPQRKQPQS